MKHLINLAHSVLASSAVGVIVDALTRTHGAAQAGETAAGLAGLAAAVISAAIHSRKTAELAHQVELDLSHVVTPALAARVAKMEQAVGKIVPVDKVTEIVEDAVKKVEAELPAPVKVAVEDVRPLVAEILRPLGPLAEALITPAPPAPADEPAPAAPAVPVKPVEAVPAAAAVQASPPAA